MHGDGTLIEDMEFDEESEEEDNDYPVDGYGETEDDKIGHKYNLATDIDHQSHIMIDDREEKFGEVGLRPSELLDEIRSVVNLRNE